MNLIKVNEFMEKYKKFCEKYGYIRIVDLNEICDYGERQQQIIKYLENLNKELYDAIIEYLSNTIHIDKETCIQVFEDNIHSWSEAVIYHCLLDLDKIKGE